MVCRARPRAAARFLFWIGFLVVAGTLNGCFINIEYLVPRHANEGDLLVLRNPNGTQRLPDELTVRFGNTAPRQVLSQTPSEIVAEVPPGLAGEMKVSVWLGGLVLVSNTRSFRVDAEPIIYRILGYGDSLMGPWVYHTDMLDKMLNENVGPSLVINEGKAGEIMSEGAQRLNHVLSIHPGVEYIFILEGANDVYDGRNTPIGEMLASLEQMIDQAVTHSLYPVILTVPPRTREALLHDQTWPTTEDWNDALYNYAFVNGIELVDLYQAFLTQPGWESFLDEDGLHLTPEGQAFIAEVLYASISPLL
jgi:lysophospholipase L1-like esterase